LRRAPLAGTPRALLSGAAPYWQASHVGSVIEQNFGASGSAAAYADLPVALAALAPAMPAD